MFADTSSWMLWGLALLVLLPVLVIGLGELSDDIGTIERWKAYTAPLMILRNGVVPLAFAAILLRQVVGLPATDLLVKIVDTLLWITVLNAALAFLNLLLFRDTAALAGQVRIPKLLLDILRFFFVVCGAAIVVSSIWGVNLGSLVTALGIGSVVIGLALQDTLGSLFAGIALVSARHFRVGDWVKFGNDEGPVLAQNWRSVTIKTRMGDTLVVPNGVIARNPLTVLGQTGSVILLVDLRFPYHHSPDMVGSMLVTAARATPDFHLDPTPTARIAAFEDNGVRYLIAVRTRDPAKLYTVRGEFLANVWFEAQRRGIEFTGQNNTRFHPHDLPQPRTPSGAEALTLVLRNCEAFEYRNADVGPLIRSAALERHRSGMTIGSAGLVHPKVYLLLAGRVRAVVTPPDGGAAVQVLAFEPGQFVLSRATLRGSPAPYALIADSEVEALALPVADFKAFCAADIKRANEIEQSLSVREEAAQRIMARTFPEQSAAALVGDRKKLVRDLFSNGASP